VQPAKSLLNDEVDRDSPYVDSCGSIDSRGIRGSRSLYDRQGEGIAFSFCVWGESPAFIMKVSVLGVSMAALVGCASKGEPIKPQTVNLVSEERVFEFLAETVAGEALPDAMIMKGLISSMHDASHFGAMNIDDVS
jgi:hypothetical protein|tara:strand:- start:614 stop:1021 length:408 start_codon:yes stop_codon:yes gene_type:complete